MSDFKDSLKMAATDLFMAMLSSEVPLPLGCAYADERRYQVSQKNVGDGTYELSPGDSVLLGNGIKLTIAFQKRADNAPLPQFTHEFVIQAFVGDDTTPVTGIPYSIVVDAKGQSPMSCVDLYRVFNVTYVTSNIDAGEPTVTLSVESLTDDKFSSREEIAEVCVHNKETVGNCEDIIPWEEFKTEKRYDEDEYTVALPEDMDPTLAFERLTQLRSCREKLVSWSGIDTTLPAVGWRYLDLAWPSSLRGIEGTEDDEYLSICHEVQNLIMSGMNLPQWFEEGLTLYSEMGISGGLTPTREDWTLLEEFEMEAGGEHVVPGDSSSYFQLLDVLPSEGFVEVSVYAPVEEQFRVPLSGLFRVAESSYVLIREIHEGHIHAASYEAPAQSGSFTPIAAFCMDDGAWAYGGRMINGVALHPLANPSFVQPEWVPYENVFSGSGVAAIYAGGACFWEQFRKKFGDEAIVRALQGLSAVREKNDEGDHEPYCVVPTLESAAGQEITDFLKRFGFTPGEPVCLPPIKSAEMMQYESPGETEWCEVSII